MSRRTLCLFSLILLLSVAGVSVGELVAYWPLDEGAGGTTPDKSGNGLDGTLVGGPGFAAGMFGPAIQFDSSNTQYVDCGTDPAFDITEQLTVAAWIKMDHVTDRQPIVNKEGDGVRGVGYRVEDDALVHVQLYKTGGAVKTDLYSTANLEAARWYHLAFTYEFVADGSSITRLYIDGAEHVSTDATVGPLETNAQIQEIGRYVWSGSYQKFFNGLIDEVVIFNHVSSAGEIQAVMNGVGGGFPLASSPDPRDGALHEDIWVTLSWRAGDSAVSHDVYLGDRFSDVAEATPDSDVFCGNQIATFYVAGFPGFAYPEGLVPGTTYYWRIDEVNDADPNSPWKGDIWSFSIPPKTAYHPDPAEGTEFVGPDNVTLSWTPGFGAKLHTVYLGDDYDEVSNATVGAPAGTATYTPGPLELEKVYYWRVDEFDGLGTYKGDIWGFTTPGAAGTPQPANGASGAAMTTSLSWTPAENANAHQVYFGMDKEAVKNATTASPEYKGSKAPGSESHDPGKLDWHTTYYWRVDAVYSANTVKGLVWSFTTADFLLIDDFESYTDDDVAGEAIWQTWVDGFGVADNGAQVGYLMPPYAEPTIVHSGLQSMPLLYTNEAGVTNSEAVLTLTTPRDWTAEGVGALSLWFRGSSANAADPLYVAISNAAGAPAVEAYDDPAAAAISVWTEWRMSLQTFADHGINLTDVDRIAIGLGTKAGMAAPGGSGTLYVDDIRLYRP